MSEARPMRETLRMNRLLEWSMKKGDLGLDYAKFVKEGLTKKQILEEIQKAAFLKLLEVKNELAKLEAEGGT